MATASETPEIASKAHHLAAQAYYLVSEPRRALHSSDAALSNARTAQQRKDALWRRFSSARELNLPDLRKYLADFSEAAGAGLDDRLRVASGHVMLGAQEGTFAGLWKIVRPLLRDSSPRSDPLVATGAFVSFCYLAIGRADYAVARKVVQTLTTKCQEHRIDFAAGFCTAIEANAEMGLGNFNRSEELLAELETAAEGHEDPYIAIEWHLAEARLGISRRRFALSSLESWNVRDLEPFQLYVAHYLSLLALAAAAEGDRALCHSLSDEALSIAHTVETLSNTEWAQVLAEPKRTKARNLAVRVLAIQDQRDYLDSFVLAYRAVPTVLALISTASPRSSNHSSSPAGESRCKTRARRNFDRTRRFRANPARA